MENEPTITAEELAEMETTMRQPASAADYGAVPDGVTDCTLACQAAADVTEARVYASRLIAEIQRLRTKLAQYKKESNG